MLRKQGISLPAGSQPQCLRCEQQVLGCRSTTQLGFMPTAGIRLFKILDSRFMIHALTTIRGQIAVTTV